MLHPKTTFELSHIVADLMENLWHKRSFLKERAYFVFRLDASAFNSDTDTSIYAHFLIEDDRWYFMMSDERFDVTYEMITERLEDEAVHNTRRVQSWRHYAFKDLVQEFIEDELGENIDKNLKSTLSQLTIWDTFPAQTIY